MDIYDLMRRTGMSRQEAEVLVQQGYEQERERKEFLARSKAEAKAWGEGRAQRKREKLEAEAHHQALNRHNLEMILSTDRAHRQVAGEAQRHTADFTRALGSPTLAQSSEQVRRAAIGDNMRRNLPIIRAIQHAKSQVR
jgi:hypothetical protein